MASSLLALGAAWNEVRLPHPVKVTAYCTALCGTYRELASDLDSCGFRHRSKFSNHFSRPQRSAMARELCRSGISTVAIAIIATSILVLWGLRGTAAEVKR